MEYTGLVVDENISLSFQITGDFTPSDKPNNVHYKRYNWHKHAMPYSKYLYFKGYEYGFDVLVVWDHSIDDYSIWIDSATWQNTIVIHPFMFCRMVASHSGTDRGLDVLQMVMRDRIKKLADKHFAWKE